LSEDGLKHDAAAIGLDPGKFNQCMAGGAETARVNRDHADGVALGVNGTPTFFVGRHALANVPDLDDLSQAIDEELTAEGVGLPSEPAAPAAPALTTAPAPKETKNPTEPTPSPAVPAKASSEPAPSGFGLLGSSSGGQLSGFSSSIETCSDAEATKKQPAVIHTDRLRELLGGNPKPLFVDVRPAKEYAAGQIPGAINIPLSDLPKSWSTLPKDRVIVFYEGGKSAGDICASGRKAGSFMLEHGYAFDHVKVYQEGLAGWQKAGL
jgi:rhodanese-related sulfurtransferase